MPIIIPNTQTQVMFNESFLNNYTITFDSWYTERKISTNGRELQVDIGSAQQNKSPKYLIGVFETQNRIGVLNKANKLTQIMLLKILLKSMELVTLEMAFQQILKKNSYLDQIRDSKVFYREYVGEQLIIPYIS